MDRKDFYKFVLDGVKDGVYFVDGERRITFWNKSAERITGFGQEDVIDHFCYDNILNHVDDQGCRLCMDGCPLHKTLEDGLERTNTVYLHHKDGHRVEVTVYIMPIIDNGEIIGAVETFTDGEEQVQVMKNLEQLKSLAYYDQLTELPNRRYIEDQFRVKMEEFRQMKVPFGFAIMDIDHFKIINDTYGHDIGDQVLKMLAKVFKASVRGTDFVGRWGGEEFVAVFSHVDKEILEKVLNRIRMLVEKSSLRLPDQQIQVTISIGATLVRTEDDLEAMYKRADQRLYTSKTGGRNRVTL